MNPHSPQNTNYTTNPYCDYELTKAKPEPQSPPPTIKQEPRSPSNQANQVFDHANQVFDHANQVFDHADFTSSPELPARSPSPFEMASALASSHAFPANLSIIATAKSPVQEEVDKKITNKDKVANWIIEILNNNKNLTPNSEEVWQSLKQKNEQQETPLKEKALRKAYYHASALIINDDNNVYIYAKNHAIKITRDCKERDPMIIDFYKLTKKSNPKIHKSVFFAMANKYLLENGQKPVSKTTIENIIIAFDEEESLGVKKNQFIKDTIKLFLKENPGAYNKGEKGSSNKALEDINKTLVKNNFKPINQNNFLYYYNKIVHKLGQKEIGTELNMLGYGDSGMVASEDNGTEGNGTKRKSTEPLRITIKIPKLHSSRSSTADA